MSQFVLRENFDDIILLSLNRPEKRNALNPEIISELRQILKEIRNDQQVRALILTGSGKAFCAGADLAYLEKISQFSESENLEDSKTLAMLFRELYSLPKITVAMVNGAALAGGLGLAMCCDYVFGDRENARLGFTEVRIGFVPAIVMNFLARRIPLAHASSLVLSGDIVKAAEAHRLGLIHQVFAPEELRVKTMDFLNNLLTQNSITAMLQTKELWQQLLELPLNEGLELSSRVNAGSRNTEDCQNGLRSFLHKKPMNWRKKSL